MSKKIVAVAAGVTAFLAVAAIAGAIMRRAWPEYAAVADAMTFTRPMLLARLTVGALATLAAGAAAAAIARQWPGVRWAAGLLLLVVFVPVHIRLWPVFPVWYHLTFLASLVPLALLGARVADVRRTRP